MGLTCYFAPLVLDSSVKGSIGRLAASTLLHQKTVNRSVITAVQSVIDRRAGWPCLIATRRMLALHSVASQRLSFVSASSGVVRTHHHSSSASACGGVGQLDDRGGPGRAGRVVSPSRSRSRSAVCLPRTRTNSGRPGRRGRPAGSAAQIGTQPVVEPDDGPGPGPPRPWRRRNRLVHRRPDSRSRSRRPAVVGGRAARVAPVLRPVVRHVRRRGREA